MQQFHLDIVYLINDFSIRFAEILLLHRKRIVNSALVTVMIFMFCLF